jgi:putative ABC transport system permease protein
MLRNYLTVAWRTLRRNKTYTLINIGGLAVAMAACLLIGLFVQQELSFDAFHEKGDRIFLAGAWTERNGEKAMFGTGFGVGETLEQRFPQVEAVARTTFPSDVPVKTGEARYEDEAFYAGARFFDVFTFPLAQGDPQTALAEPNSVVLTPKAARKYFGDDNPMGRTLTVDARGEERPFTVTGVTEPVPETTYLSFDLLLSAETIDPRVRGAGIYQTFALLRSPEAVEPLRKLRPKELDEGAREEQKLTFVSLPDLYPSDFTDQPGFRGDPRYLYVFSAIAAFILLIATINYANLATARAAQRAREVGVRKTAGATRFQIARQFLGESVLLSVAALGLALLLARGALPAFNTLMGASLALELAGNGPLLLGLAALVLVTGVLAGSYPALYLSGFRPVGVLGRQQRSSGGSSRLRRGLVVVQFAVSTALIVGTAVVWQQLRYMQTKDLGFDKEQVVVLPMGGDALKDRHETVKRALQQHPNVVGAAAASAVPGEFNITSGVRFDYRGETKETRVKRVYVDSDFIDVLGLRLAEGRSFSEARATDSTGAFILNRAALDSLGWQTGVGKPFFTLRSEGEVIGVVDNFHFASPREGIEPVAFSTGESYYRLAVRIRPENMQETLGFLEEQWKRFVAEKPFEYTFLGEKFNEMYEAERRLSRTVGLFATLAVLIACVGLFGLAALAAERRTGEIAIRKTFGASTGQIVGLLSKDFLKLVAVGFALAVPVAWWGMQRWLEGFAYRIDLGPLLFLAAGALTLLVALVATGTQALRAARTNPAQALRDE